MDDLLTRLWRRTTVVGDCWVFDGFSTGKDGSEGYQGISWKGRNHRVHRLVYTTMVDDQIEGLDVHHRCGVKACWRPEHLAALTRHEHRQQHLR